MSKRERERVDNIKNIINFNNNYVRVLLGYFDT